MWEKSQGQETEGGQIFFFSLLTFRFRVVHPLVFILLQTPGMLAGTHPAASLEKGFQPKALCYPHIWTLWGARSSSAAASPLLL